MLAALRQSIRLRPQCLGAAATGLGVGISLTTNIGNAGSTASPWSVMISTFSTTCPSIAVSAFEEIRQKAGDADMTVWTAMGTLLSGARAVAFNFSRGLHSQGNHALDFVLACRPQEEFIITDAASIPSDLPHRIVQATPPGQMQSQMYVQPPIQQATQQTQFGGAVASNAVPCQQSPFGQAPVSSSAVPTQGGVWVMAVPVAVMAVGAAAAPNRHEPVDTRSWWPANQQMWQHQDVKMPPQCMLPVQRAQGEEVNVQNMEVMQSAQAPINEVAREGRRARQRNRRRALQTIGVDSFQSKSKASVLVGGSVSPSHSDSASDSSCQVPTTAASDRGSFYSSSNSTGDFFWCNLGHQKARWADIEDDDYPEVMSRLGSSRAPVSSPAGSTTAGETTSESECLATPTVSIGDFVGHVYEMALTAEGCRMVQERLIMASTQDQATMVSELQGHVWEASRSPHANYVLQKAIEVLPPDSLQFVIDELQGRVPSAARHRFSCRVIQRLLENGRHDQTRGIADDILANSSTLLRHPYGNFVLQTLLEHGTEEQRAKVIDVLLDDVVDLARHRIGSHIVQCALVNAGPHNRGRLVDVLLKDGKELSSLKRSEYGSFVAREALAQRQALSNA